MEGTKGHFRIQSKGWFLTWPRCELKKEEVRDLLRSKGKDIRELIVSRELHNDGTPHCHAYLYLGAKFDCSNPRFWDLGEHHGNYQKAKSLRAVQSYIAKDGDILQEGIDYKVALAAQATHRSQAGVRLMQGESLASVIKDFPEDFINLPRLEQAVACWQRLNAAPLPRASGFIPNTFQVLLPLRTDKQRHYWFWSDLPNKGKTTFLKNLEAAHPAAWYSYVEKYQTIHPGVQFIMLDEYSTGHLTVTQINQMCDGTYQYPVKGGSPVKPIDCTIVVCGNRSPLDIYDVKHHELIKARFNVHYLQ